MEITFPNGTFQLRMEVHNDDDGWLAQRETLLLYLIIPTAPYKQTHEMPAWAGHPREESQFLTTETRVRRSLHWDTNVHFVSATQGLNCGQEWQVSPRGPGSGSDSLQALPGPSPARKLGGILGNVPSVRSARWLFRVTPTSHPLERL